MFLSSCESLHQAGTVLGHWLVKPMQVQATLTSVAALYLLLGGAQCLLCGILGLAGTMPMVMTGFIGPASSTMGIVFVADPSGLILALTCVPLMWPARTVQRKRPMGTSSPPASHHSLRSQAACWSWQGVKEALLMWPTAVILALVLLFVAPCLAKQALATLDGQAASEQPPALLALYCVLALALVAWATVNTLAPTQDEVVSRALRSFSAALLPILTLMLVAPVAQWGVAVAGITVTAGPILVLLLPILVGILAIGELQGALTASRQLLHHFAHEARGPAQNALASVSNTFKSFEWHSAVSPQLTAAILVFYATGSTVPLSSVLTGGAPVSSQPAGGVASKPDSRRSGPTPSHQQTQHRGSLPPPITSPIHLQEPSSQGMSKADEGGLAAVRNVAISRGMVPLHTVKDGHGGGTHTDSPSGVPPRPARQTMVKSKTLGSIRDAREALWAGGRTSLSPAAAFRHRGSSHATPNVQEAFRREMSYAMSQGASSDLDGAEAVTAEFVRQFFSNPTVVQALQRELGGGGGGGTSSGGDSPASGPSKTGLGGAEGSALAAAMHRVASAPCLREHVLAPTAAVSMGLLEISSSLDFLKDNMTATLDFARMQSGKQKLNPAPFGISYVVGKLQHSSRRSFAARGVTVTWRDASLPTLIACEWMGDRQRICQAAMNILSNASKYSPQDTGQVEVLTDLQLDLPTPAPRSRAGSLFRSGTSSGTGTGSVGFSTSVAVGLSDAAAAAEEEVEMLEIPDFDGALAALLQSAGLAKWTRPPPAAPAVGLVPSQFVDDSVPLPSFPPQAADSKAHVSAAGIGTRSTSSAAHSGCEGCPPVSLPKGTKVTFTMRVKDNGPGMTLQQQDAVFDDFTRLHKDNNGTGLGLGIARAGMRLHGGDVTVQSDGPGQGCTFILSVPLQLHAGRTAYADSELSASEEEESAEPLTPGGHTIGSRSFGDRLHTTSHTASSDGALSKSLMRAVSGSVAPNRGRLSPAAAGGSIEDFAVVGGGSAERVGDSSDPPVAGTGPASTPVSSAAPPPRAGRDVSAHSVSGSAAPPPASPASRQTGGSINPCATAHGASAADLPRVGTGGSLQFLTGGRHMPTSGTGALTGSVGMSGALSGRGAEDSSSPPASDSSEYDTVGGTARVYAVQGGGMPRMPTLHSTAHTTSPSSTTSASGGTHSGWDVHTPAAPESAPAQAVSSAPPVSEVVIASSVTRTSTAELVGGAVGPGGTSMPTSGGGWTMATVDSLESLEEDHAQPEGGRGGEEQGMSHSGPVGLQRKQRGSLKGSEMSPIRSATGGPDLHRIGSGSTAHHPRGSLLSISSMSSTGGGGEPSRVSGPPPSGEGSIGHHRGGSGGSHYHKRGGSGFTVDSGGVDASSASVGPRRQPKQRAMHILLADDDKTLRKLLRRNLPDPLQTLHYAALVDAVPTGEAALELWREVAAQHLAPSDSPPPTQLKKVLARLPFTHVILDSNMPPGMSGQEAARMLRAGGFEGVILGLTGDGEPEDIAAFKDAGADNVLVKPVYMEDMAKALRKAARSRKAARASVCVEGLEPTKAATAHSPGKQLGH